MKSHLNEEQELQFAIVASYPRCGTNFFCHDLLGQFVGLASLGEIFHYIPNTYPWDYRLRFQEFKQLRLEIQENPNDVMRAAAEDLFGDRAKLAVAKLFPDHIEYDHLGEVISKVGGVIVLWRNPLYSWASDALAGSKGNWAHANTEDHRVVWNFRHFVDYTRHNLSFIRKIIDCAQQANLPIIEVRYVELFELQKLKRVMRRWLYESGLLNSNDEVQELPYVAGFVKQDARPIIERIRRPDRLTMKYDLRELGLLELLDEESSIGLDYIADRISQI